MGALSPTAQVQELLRRGVMQYGGQQRLLLQYGELLLRHGPAKLFMELGQEALIEFIARRHAFVHRRDPSPFSLRLSGGPSEPKERPLPYAVVEILVDDRPFLIDSIQNFLVARNTPILAILHPILNVKRDTAGRMTAVADFDPKGANEAHIFFLVAPVPSGLRSSLLDELRAILHDVIRCVDDYPRVEEQLERIHREAREFKGGRAVSRLLQWFRDGNFVFMGHLPYRAGADGLTPLIERGLGLFHPSLRLESHHDTLIADATGYLNKAAAAEPFYVVEETSILSRMHHRSHLSMLLFSAQPGEARSEASVVAGIFTDHSVRVDAMNIPVVQTKLGAVVRRYGIAPGSYKHKEVLDFLNGLPRFELFRLSQAMLKQMLGFFLAVVDQPRTEVALLPDAKLDAVRVLFSVPGREIAQEQVQHIRGRVEGLFHHSAQNVFCVRVSTFCVVGFVFHRAPSEVASLPDAALVEEAVREALLSREDRLVRHWLAARGSGLEESLARTLMEGLPEEYKVCHGDLEIMTDLSRLEQLTKTDQPQFLMCRAERDRGIKLVLYGWEKLSLSRLMPIFSNLRLLVEEEETFEVRILERSAYLHTFLLHASEGLAIRPETHEQLLRNLIFNILSHRAENDPLNALLFASGFDWRQIALMQLYRNYLVQVGTVYTKRTINETLIRRSRATGALFRMFDARFRPDRQARDAARKEAEAGNREADREIETLTEDRIFKGLRNLIEATVRTNFYQNAEDPVIAVKLHSASIEQLPSPRPLYEIYVSSPLMEGIHLRGDKIARGGIRYSDRPDDFRTEVLGLMATQTKKNALIVPLGSKGGFVVKDLAPYGGNARTAGDACYHSFIGALLSITDNLVQGRTVPPANVVRHDADDPYLVVAADKGTAHLSDTANQISAEREFWLGDAFASGGSHGYDHKAVAITARGAWESVKRLFWERGLDIEREPVTVVGIGDMSGDVFGNGVLLSPMLKLVAAFDHRHIFIDPHPDPQTAYSERARLFKLPRSAWSDYNADLISEGGGVYPRGAKAIPLSPPLQAMLATDESSLSGEEMIRALLGMKVDLLWNGGIGTYVKSAAETHAAVGDPNNDSVRIDAAQLGAKVVGEGGNLGLTQLARIDYDLAGGGIHTDAIDNAAGVNMSDHEVNLKILLSPLMNDGQLPDRAARNALLEELEPAVTAAVLRANFRQVLVITMDRLRSLQDMGLFVRLVELLATEGGLDRRTEAIPNTQRLQGWHSEGQGIPRPILAVLLAYTKMTLYRRIVESPLVASPDLERFFLDYFPRTLSQRFDLAGIYHPLKGEIIATAITNRVIDQAGMTFVPETASFSGKSWHDVVEVYLLADAVVNGPEYREQIYGLATQLPADVQHRLLMELEVLLAAFVRWLLLHKRPEHSALARQTALREEFEAFSDALPFLLSKEQRKIVAGATDRSTRMGLPSAAARFSAQVPFLGGFARASGLASEGGISFSQAFQLSNSVDTLFRFTELEAALTSIPFSDRMHKRFADGLLRSLERHRHAKALAVLDVRQKAAPPEKWVEAYLGRHAGVWSQYEVTLRQVLDNERPDAVALAVAIGQLEAL